MNQLLPFSNRPPIVNSFPVYVPRKLALSVRDYTAQLVHFLFCTSFKAATSLTKKVFLTSFSSQCTVLGRENFSSSPPLPSFKALSPTNLDN